MKTKMEIAMQLSTFYLNFYLILASVTTDFFEYGRLFFKHFNSFRKWQLNGKRQN